MMVILDGPSMDIPFQPPVAVIGAFKTYEKNCVT